MPVYLFFFLLQSSFVLSCYFAYLIDSYGVWKVFMHDGYRFSVRVIGVGLVFGAALGRFLTVVFVSIRVGLSLWACSGFGDSNSTFRAPGFGSPPWFSISMKLCHFSAWVCVRLPARIWVSWSDSVLDFVVISSLGFEFWCSCYGLGIAVSVVFWFIWFNLCCFFGWFWFSLQPFLLYLGYCGFLLFHLVMFQ